MSSSRNDNEGVRLLPEAIEASARAFAIRLLGCTLVGIAAVSWIGMLSWTVSDPSLTIATGHPVRNLLGPLGATLSDLMIQTLGLAAVFALAGPMIWGLELLAELRPLPGLRQKLLAFPGGVLALAGALSGLPSISAWPLHNGYGGMLGDLVNNMVAMSVLGLSPERAGSIATLALGLAGAVLYVIGLGIAARHLLQMLPFRLPAALVAEPAAPATRAAEMPAEEIRLAAELPEVPAAADVAPGNSLSIAPEAEFERGEAFDRETDAQAAAVAQRFAAAGSATSAVDTADASRDRPVQPAEEPRRAAFEPIATDTARNSRSIAGWGQPRIDLLVRPGAERASHSERMMAADRAAGLVVDALVDYGVNGAICGIKPGPVVTRFEFEPARGTKTARVIGLADDIARSLGAHSVRIAVVPGRNAIGIEVPNPQRETVHLSEVIDTETFQSTPALLPLALGKGIGGEVVVADLARMPHLLIGGTTGSGKSVGINTMILSLVWRMSPEQCRLLLIDPKRLELAGYNGIPHLLSPVVTDVEAAAGALEWAVEEMERRYTLMAKAGVRSLPAYNARARRSKALGHGLVRTVQTGFDPLTGKPIFEHEHLDSDPLPYIVVVVDELADLMLTAGPRIEAAIQRLAQMARAAGIHLIVATQRPSVDVVTGTIKANFPMRLAFRVASRIDSRTILGEGGAEMLLGYGDMLLSAGSGQPLRIHGAYVGDDELQRVCDALRTGIAPASTAADSEEAYDDAVAVVLADRKVSPGHLRRQLGISEALAARLIDRMQADGLVGPLDRFNRRRILAASPPAARQDVVA